MLKTSFRRCALLAVLLLAPASSTGGKVRGGHSLSSIDCKTNPDASECKKVLLAEPLSKRDSEYEVQGNQRRLAIDWVAIGGGLASAALKEVVSQCKYIPVD
jgi:hypothetical protein